MSGYVLNEACVRALIKAAELCGVDSVTFGVLAPGEGIHPALPGYRGVIREDVAVLRRSLPQPAPPNE